MASTIVISLLLALVLGAVFVYVDWRLTDPPRPPLTWKRVAIGAVVWTVFGLLIDTVVRMGERAGRID